MKELRVLVKDKNTLMLLEDGKKDDLINLSELANVDLTTIEELINSGKDQVYQKKLNELKYVLEQEKKSALEVLKLGLISKHQEELKKLEETISNNDSNKALEIEKLNSNYNLEIVKLKTQVVELEEASRQKLETLRLQMLNSHEQEKNKLITQLETLKSTLDEKILNERLTIEQKYTNELAELKKQLAELKSEKEITILKKESEYEEEINKLKLAHSEEINKKNEIINQKEMMYNELQNRKAALNVKMIGEGLEIWCDNEMTSYMQNGFLNCSWDKDNKVVKGEDEAAGTKADFIFNIYASEERKEDELLAGVCLEMKDENPNSTHKKKNADYLPTLHKNRVKKGCKYAILVSNLELDNPNDLPILKVRDYEDMYIVRPAYMIVLLNMITSLTTNFKDLLLQAHKEELEIKAKTVLLEEFESLKKTYLEKELENLEKQVNNIKKKSLDIIKAAEDIDSICLSIINGYLTKIQAKLETFEAKINREYRRFEKNC